MNPGMLLRLDSTSINSMKDVLQDLAPKRLLIDMNLPENYTFAWNTQIPGLEWDITFQDIKYHPIELDMTVITVDLEPGYDGDGLLRFDFPALKHWQITAHMITNSWIFGDEGDIDLTIKGLDIDYSCYFKLDDQGYLDPVVFKVKVDMGDTDFQFENWFYQLFFRQFVEFGIVVLENSAWFTGEYLFSAILGPIMDTQLNHYQKYKNW